MPTLPRLTTLPKTAAALFLLPALLLGACGQTPTAALPAPANTVTTPAKPAPVLAAFKFKVFIPNPSAAATQSIGTQSLHPQYLSSATAQLHITLGTVDQTVTLDDSICTPVEGGRTCAISMNVAPGAHQTLTIVALDAGGTVLSTSVTTVDIVVGQDNALTSTLTGVASKAVLVPLARPDDVTVAADGSVLLDRGGVYAGSLSLYDASNQLIMGAGVPQVKVESSNPDFGVGTPDASGRLNVTAPDPTDAAQSTVLSVMDLSGKALGSVTMTVPAETLQLSLSSQSPVAGDNVQASVQLASAQGQALHLAGRSITFSGAQDASVMGSAQTDDLGTASVMVSTGSFSGKTGVVTAVSGQASGTASYLSVSGAATEASSSVSLGDQALKVGGTTQLRVWLGDVNGNAVLQLPSVTVEGHSVVGEGVLQGSTYIFPVTAAAAPESSVFTVMSAGKPVGSATLMVTPYVLNVMDGPMVVQSGSQYDFQNDAAHDFAVSEQAYSGSFTATSDQTAVATATVKGNVVTVTPGSTAGIASITVSDASGQTFSFKVSVTTASLTIN